MFLTGQGTGVQVDFSKRKLVGMGHSMGAVCLYVSDMPVENTPEMLIQIQNLQDDCRHIHSPS